MIRLFNVKNGVVTPSEHCYTLNPLKEIMKAYEEDKDYLQVYYYLFYMTCPSEEDNPFFNVKETDKEELILKQIDVTAFSVEDELVIEGLALCRSVYETPSLRAFEGIKQMLDRLATYMMETPIKDGRDGNITALTNTASKFDQIRQSFKGAYEDLKKEQGDKTGRGGQKLAYDQQ